LATHPTRISHDGYEPPVLGRTLLSIPGQIRIILSARTIIAGRRSHPTIALVIVFGWILVVFSLCQTYFFGRWVRCQSHYADLADLAIAPTLLVVLAIGIPATWRLLSDRKWLAFLHTQPLSPSAVLASLCLERWARVGPYALFVGLYVWGVNGPPLLSSLTAILSIVVSATILLGTLQVLITLAARVASGHAVLKILLVVLLAVALSYPFFSGLHQRTLGDDILKATFVQIDSHPLVHLVGLTDVSALARTDVPWPNRCAILGWIFLRVLVSGLAMLLLLRHSAERLTRPVGSVRSTLLTLATRPIDRLLRKCRTVWITQGCLELLLLLRQGNAITALCAFGALLVLAVARSSPGGDTNATHLMPVVGLFVAMVIGSDGLTEMLDRRSPYRLYRVCGTDPGDYAAGLALVTATLSVLVVLACLPILIGEWTFSAYASSALAAVVLAACEAAIAALISLYLHPIVPSLGFIGKIKAGMILLLSLWLVMLTFSALMIMPVILAVLFWWLKKQSLAGFLWRRIWNADPLR